MSSSEINPKHGPAIHTQKNNSINVTQSKQAEDFVNGKAAFSKSNELNNLTQNRNISSSKEEELILESAGLVKGTKGKFRKTKARPGKENYKQEIEKEDQTIAPKLEEKDLSKSELDELVKGVESKLKELKEESRTNLEIKSLLSTLGINTVGAESDSKELSTKASSQSQAHSVEEAHIKRNASKNLLETSNNKADNKQLMDTTTKHTLQTPNIDQADRNKLYATERVQDFVKDLKDLQARLRNNYKLPAGLVPILHPDNKQTLKEGINKVEHAY